MVMMIMVMLMSSRALFGTRLEIRGWRTKDDESRTQVPQLFTQISDDRIKGVQGNISRTALAKKGKTSAGREIAKSRLAGTSVVQVYLPPNSSPRAGGGDPIKPVVQIY